MRPALLLLVAALLVGCGETLDRASPPPSPATARPALLRAPARPGEIIVRGEATPATHGPYRLHGRYLVRFEQYAPEDRALDFGGQTSFVAALQRRAGDATGAVRLFRAARRTGRRVIRLDGRYFVDASFGDFPFVIRITPRSSAAVAAP